MGVPVYRVVLDKLRFFLQDQVSAIIGSYRHTTCIGNSVCCIFVNRFLFVKNQYLIRQLIHGAVLAETMEQKKIIFTIRQRFMEWFVSPNFWLNSRNYFQFSIVSVDD